MTYKNTIAEIYEEDKDENETNLWVKEDLADKKIKQTEKDISDLNKNVGDGYPGGLKYILENKNEFDPGHSHLFPPRDFTVIQSFFESKDGWASGGVGTEVVTPQIGGLSLTTGASTSDDAWILGTTTGFNSFDVSQLSVFQSVLKVNLATSITGYWGVGDITAGGAFGGANEEGYGFKYVSGTLSALSVKNGTEVLTTIPGITATNFNEYRAIFDGIRSILYFVNGKLVAKHTTSIPDTDDDIFATFYVKTATTAARTMYVKNLYFVQQN